MNKTPTVSVITITYNQELYIREALDSLVAQKTKFLFEVIISDDCSTDLTPQIIEEYSRKYPAIIKPIFRKKNIGAQRNCIEALKVAKGEYIALCEGDDYWTDVNKLQLQVDFLDDNPNYAVCFHSVRVFYQDKQKADEIFPDIKEINSLTTTELLRHNYIQTNSVMYKRQDYHNIPVDIMPLDWYLHLYHAQFGDIGFINKTMSAYRRHKDGLWWNSDKDVDQLLKKHGVTYIAFYVALLEIFGGYPEKSMIIYSRITDLFSKLFAIDHKQKTNLVKQALKKYPQMIEPVIAYQSEELQQRENRINLQAKSIEDIESRLLDQSSEISEITQELDIANTDLAAIKGSKLWRFRAGLYGAMRRMEPGGRYK